MTTPTNSAPHSGERAWAAEQLGLTAGDLAAQRASLARQLQGHDFLPPTDWQALVRTVLDEHQAPVLTIAESLLTGRRDFLRGQVEAFCAEFFQLPPEPRRERHAELLAQCAADALLVARLRALEPGLNLDREALSGPGTPEVKTLADWILKQVVLRPHDRAIARQACLRLTQSDPGKWAAAAQALEKLHPNVASLGPWILLQLKPWKLKQREVESAQRRRKRSYARTSETVLGRWRQTIFWGAGATLLVSALLSKMEPPASRIRPTKLDTSSHLPPEFWKRLDTQLPPFVRRTPQSKSEPRSTRQKHSRIRLDDAPGETLQQRKNQDKLRKDFDLLLPGQ
ncbi:MAG TPA: hypothetical protein VHY20_03280 [Pirellulales bacterium]|jgi:hypothetical protein|nr:hypothetical protein [Pirellulales bacterium]